MADTAQGSRTNDLASARRLRMPHASGGIQGVSVSSRMHFSPEDRRSSLKAALDHAEVRPLLSGTWEALSCNLVWERGRGCQVRHRVRVCIFNYTENRLIEVCVEDGSVVSVEVRPSHECPASPLEMAQAIALARAAPGISGEVQALDAHAILQIPDAPEMPSHGHRCILVMFTEIDRDPDRELPVLFSAMVDLVAQQVLRAGPADCPCQAKRDSTPPVAD